MELSGITIVAFLSLSGIILVADARAYWQPSKLLLKTIPFSVVREKEATFDPTSSNAREQSPPFGGKGFQSLKTKLKQELKLPNRGTPVSGPNIIVNVTVGIDLSEDEPISQESSQNHTLETQSADANYSRILTGLTDEKIVGGINTDPREWPWQASIQYLGDDLCWKHFCSGSLVSPRWVVTAAHCVAQLQDYTIRVVAGEYRLSIISHHEQVINPEKIYMHGYFDTVSYLYDIAMVKLVHNVSMTSSVQVIQSITPRQDTENNHAKCHIAGWGNVIGSTTELYLSDILQQSPMRVLSHSECSIYNYELSNSQLCVFSHVASACMGDSGGPLVCAVGNEWRLTGVASWVSSSTCAPSYPNLYTRMSFFMDWMNTVMDTK